MSYFDSKYLRAARSLGAKDWSNPKVIQLARHMAHAGATFDEIYIATGWGCKDYTARKRLSKFNIRPRALRGAPHRGDLPYLSPSVLSATGDINQRSYRPRGAA